MARRASAFIVEKLFAVKKMKIHVGLLARGNKGLRSGETRKVRLIVADETADRFNYVAEGYLNEASCADAA